MDIRKLQRVIVDGLEDVKAQNIVVFNTEHLSSLFERVIIASGTSNRQTKSLASSVREAVKKAGFPVPRLEGEDNGEWIIVDCGAAVAHVMQPAIRDYYHLEEIWGDKPVKLDGVATKLVKASEPAAKPAAGKDTPAKRAALGRTGAKVPAKRGAAEKAPAKKVGEKTPSRSTSHTSSHATSHPSPRSASRSAPSKAPARPAAKKAAPKAGVTRVVGVKKSATRSPATKGPAKKAPPRKTAARG
jgi:ribosome-associated protein